MPATDVEAIVDDSGSMSRTDSYRLRVAALDLFISKPQNASLSLGVVEFGSRADRLFAPELVGPHAGSMKSILASRIRADGGGTNYNDAFALATKDNPRAGARIFLTDGGHNYGAYLDGHRGGPPTYVIGLTIGAARAGGSDAQRLQRIADETGGRYYPQQDASTLQATVNEINSLMDCQQAPLRIVDSFAKENEAHAHSTAIPKGTSTVELTTTWNDPANAFTLTVVGQGVASRTSGATYVVVRIATGSAGTLRFSVKATRLATGGALAITQIARNRAGPSGAALRTVQLATFVDRVENVLRQSAAGRRELGAAIGAGLRCSISARVAARRVASVASNRQSILGQLGYLRGPTQQANAVVTLLQRSMQLSIEADRHYRDGFLAAAAQAAGCPLQTNAGFAAAHATDTQATAAKQRFATAFNALAARFHRRTWKAGEF